jgi:hypothetical protein
MNNKIQGWANYFKFYHIEDRFVAANRAISQLKAKDAKLKSVKEIDLAIIRPLISIKEWQSYFNN